MELLGNSNDRASRCDEFINPRFAEVAGCTEPNRGSGAGWKTTYDRAAGNARCGDRSLRQPNGAIPTSG